jgi:hypothetical protein
MKRCDGDAAAVSLTAGWFRRAPPLKPETIDCHADTRPLGLPFRTRVLGGAQKLRPVAVEQGFGQILETVADVDEQPRALAAGGERSNWDSGRDHGAGRWLLVGPFASSQSRREGVCMAPYDR